MHPYGYAWMVREGVCNTMDVTLMCRHVSLVPMCVATRA